MAITDQHNRIHNYLRISLTERCNLRCFYCMPPEGIVLKPRSSFMTFEEIEHIAKVFISLGVNKIRLTGGEPLVRNDAREIIKTLSELPVELAVTTNGILIDEYIETLVKNKVRSVNVSLDTLRPDRFIKITHRDYHSRVQSNINLLLENHFHVKVNIVLIRDINDDEIIDFVEWTKNKNIHIRFIEYMPFDGNSWNWNKGVSLERILDNISKRFGKRVIKLEDGINDTAKNYAIEGHIGTYAIISSVTNPFCDTCNRMRLTADGKMKNCLFSSSETNLLEALRSGKDIRPMILENVWRKNPIRSGMNTLESLGKKQNRSMVAIGG